MNCHRCPDTLIMGLIPATVRVDQKSSWGRVDEDGVGRVFEFSSRNTGFTLFCCEQLLVVRN